MLLKCRIFSSFLSFDYSIIEKKMFCIYFNSESIKFMVIIQDDFMLYC